MQFFVVEVLHQYSNPYLHNLKKWNQIVEASPRRADDDNRKRRPQPTRLLSVRLDEAAVARLVERYRAGASSRQLANELGINKTSVITMLRTQSVTIRNGRITHEDIEEAKRLYASGRSVAMIGRKLNYSPKTIWNQLTKAGVRMRDTQGR